MEINALDVI